ncbi:MAG: TraX family protein [Alphaproteobacteria bacterium]
MTTATMRRHLPKELTSYDLLKSLALILMICDHVGYFFYPEEMWFRTLGRLCLPIWFFLIGYARTSAVPWSFWVGGGIVLAVSMIAGRFLLPLNILFTMAFLRIYRDWVVRHGLASAEALRGMFFILLLLFFPSEILVEYGSLAMLIVVVGFIARRKEAVYKLIERKYVLIYVAAAFFSMYFIVGIKMPSLSNAQALVLTVGYPALGFLLWRFKPMVFEGARRYMAGSFIGLFKFMGRWTLEIYVAHIVIFQGLAFYFYPERYQFGAWQFVNSSAVAIFGMG